MSEGRPPAPPSLPGEEVFPLLFDAYPDALLVVDAAGTIAMGNPAAAALLGYDVGELRGMAVDALVPDSIRHRHAAYREAYAHAPRTRPMGNQMDLVARRKDGSEVRVEIALSPLRSRGMPLVVAAIRDVGSYPRVRQAMQRARHAEQLAKLGRIAVDARDPQVLVEQVTAVAVDALQAEAAVVYLLGNDRRTFMVASAAGVLAGKAGAAASTQGEHTLSGYVMARGAAVHVPELAAETRFTVPRPFVDAGLVCALAVPVSDRGRAVGALVVGARAAQHFGEDEARFLESLANLLATTLQRAQTEEALNHSQRLETVGQLTGGIAHDFNNLLTVIQGNLQVLEEMPALADDPHGAQLVAAATRATWRAAELTGKLLAFSRRQVLKPTQVDVGAMLQSLADMLRRTLDQRIRIEVDAPPAGTAVVADPGQLESALLNIAVNARDAMPAGGTLAFRARVCAALPAEVRRELGEAAQADADYVAIAVADTGAGMPDDVKERAFEPFFTTKEVGRGTGLGLSTVYGFVKQSRGAVALASAPGAGTELTLYLPRPAEMPGRGDAADERSDARVPPGLRVLLVEDDPEVRSVVQAFLLALRCDVAAVASGEAALERMHSAGAFDVLLTDIALGAGMRGTELASQAQARDAALRILLMSGFSEELLDADRESPEAWELLRKPFSRGELSQALARLTAARADGEIRGAA
jgi:PAS domain S-box-containing protein